MFVIPTGSCPAATRGKLECGINMDEQSQTWFTLLEDSSEWNSNVSQCATGLATSTFISSTRKQKDLPLLSKVLLNSCGQILSPIKSVTKPEVIQTFENTGNLTQYTLKSTDESAVNIPKSTEKFVLQKPNETRNLFTLDTSRLPIFNEHLNHQNNGNCSNEFGATANDVPFLCSAPNNPLTKEPTSLQFPYPNTKSMQTQIASFEFKLSNLHGDKTDLLNVPPNHSNSLPAVFDPVLLVRTEPVGQDLSKSHRSLSAPLSTAKVNEVTNQKMVSHKVKDDITDLSDSIVIDSLANQESQYQIKDYHLDDINEIPTNATDAARSVDSSTNATGCASNLSSVKDYMSVNERLKLLPLTSNTVKDNEKINDNLVNAQENTASLFPLESYSESRDRFMLLEGQCSTTVSSVSNKGSTNHRSAFDLCIRENSAPVGSESNVQSLNPRALNLSFSDSDEETTDNKKFKKDFDYSLPFAEQERLLPTGADSEFLEQEAKNGKITKSKYFYRPKNKRSDLEPDQPENISEEVNDVQILNTNKLLYNRYVTTTEQEECIEAKVFERPNLDIQDSTEDISKSVDKSNIIFHSLDSLNVNNHATFDDIKGLTESFAVISKQMDHIKTSFDLNKQTVNLNSRTSSELENEDNIAKRFLQNSIQLEGSLNDTFGRFIYGSDSSFKTSTNLTQQNPSDNFSGKSILDPTSNLKQQEPSSTSFLQTKDNSGNVDTEEDDTDELIRMASKLVVDSYTTDISEDANQTQSSTSNSQHSAINTDVSREKSDSRLSNILTESGRGTMPHSEEIVTPPQTNSTSFQSQNSYCRQRGEIIPPKMEGCKQNENVTSTDLSNAFLETNLALINHSSKLTQQEKTTEVCRNKTNYKKKRFISASAAITENFPNISSSSSSKDYTSQYDSNSSRLFDYDISQDSDSLGRQVNNLLCRTAYLECKPSTSDHFKSNVLHQPSQDKSACPLPYANTSINSNKNSEITDGASDRSEDTSFSRLKQDLIDLQNGLNENLCIEKKQLGISDNWSPLKNVSTEDNFTHSDKDLIDFNEPRLRIEDNKGSLELMPNSDLSKFDFKNSSPTEKNTSLSLPLPLANTVEEKKTFESLHISWQNEDTSLKNFTSFKDFFKCSVSSKNDNQKLQKQSNSTSFSSLQPINIQNSSSNQSPYNQPLTNDSLELKDDLSLRVERLLSKESYEIPKMSCLQNVRPREGFFPKPIFGMNSSSEIEIEPRLMEEKSSTVMPKFDKKVDNVSLINQTASPVPSEDFEFFDPLRKSNSENKVQNVSKESMKINSLNESLQKPIFNHTLIQGLKAPENYVAASLASKISNVSHLVTSGLHSTSNNDFTSVNGKNNNSKPVDLSTKDSLYTTGDLKRPEDIIRNQLNSPNYGTNEAFQNPAFDSLNSTKFPEDDVRKCLDWSDITDFDSPAKERCQDTNSKHSTLFLSKSSLSQSFNYVDMLNPEPFPRNQENNSKNHGLSNSKNNLPNKPAHLSTFEEPVPNHSATSEDCVDYEFLRTKISPKIHRPELNTNDNSSGNMANMVVNKNQSPVLHRSESFQKSLFLNQSLNTDPSLRPRDSINRSHSLEEFQNQKVSSLSQRKNTCRTKPRNSSELLSSSSDSDSLKSDLNKLSADFEQAFERRVRHAQLMSSLPNRIGMMGEHISIGVSPKYQYPYSLPTSLNGNRDLFEFNSGREDSRIHSLLSKYELPMEKNIGSSSEFSHKNSAHNPITASSGDSLCINSRYSKTESEEISQSDKFEPESNTVGTVLLAAIMDSEEAKDNQESADMYHSSSCDPGETSSQSKPNPSPSGSDSSTLSQKTWTLRPYKPAGSQDWYYTEGSEFPPFSACDNGTTTTTATTTTVESGDTGSDDAIGPYIQKEFLGSRPDGPSKPGIYSRVPGKNKSNAFDNPLLSTIQERSILNDKGKMKTKTKQEVKESISSYREARRNWVDGQDTYSTFDTKKLAESNCPNQELCTATKVDYMSSDRRESFRKNSSSKEQFDHTKNKGSQRFRNVCDEVLDSQGIKRKERTMHGIQDANGYKQSSFESVTTVETPSDFSTDPESTTSSIKTFGSSHFVSHDSNAFVLALAKEEGTDVQQAWGDLANTGQNLPTSEQVVLRSDMSATYKPIEPAKSPLSRKDYYSHRTKQIVRSSQELDGLWQKFQQQTSPPSLDNSLDSSRLEQIQHLVKNPAQALVRRSINLLELKRQQQAERAEHRLELQKQALLKQKLQDVDESTQSSVNLFTSSAESVYSLSENVETMSPSYWSGERDNASVVYSGSFDPMIAKLRKKIEKQRIKCELMKKRDKASEEKLHKLTNILVTRQMNDLILASEMNTLSTTSTATCLSNSTMESVEQSSSKKIPLHSQYCGKCRACSQRLSSKLRHSSRLKNTKRSHRETSTNFHSKHTARSTESKFGTSSLTVANLSSKHNVKCQSVETHQVKDDHRIMVAPTSNEFSEKQKTLVRKVRPKQDATTMVPSPQTVCDASQEDMNTVSVAVQTSPLLEDNTKYQTATKCTPSNNKTSIKTSIKTTLPDEIQIKPKLCLAEDLKVIPVPLMWTPKKQKAKNKTLHSVDNFYRSQKKKVTEKDKKVETWFVSLSETNISRTDRNSRPSCTSNYKRTRRPVVSDSAQLAGIKKVAKRKEKIPVIFNNSFDNNSFSSQSNKSRRTLQETFQNNMQNWISRCRERQKRISLAAQERRYQFQMEMERNTIFQNKKPSTTASENDPIFENLYKPKKREFSKQEMKELNWKLYKNLPEVLNQKVEQTRKIQYRCNKTKSRVFSMKIQNNILNKVSKKI